MPRRTKDGEALSKTIAFRLTERDYKAYRIKFEASGLSQSEFFRTHVLTNTTRVIARPKPSVDRQRLLYLANKSSNNLNQLAHRANADHLAGTLTEAAYLAMLDELQALARAFKAAVAVVD